MDKTILEIQKIIGIENVLLNEPMKNHTSFKIGGPARAVVLPRNVEEIQKTIRLLDENNIKHYILGNGTNVLFPDDGYNGIVIKIAKQFSDINIDGDVVYAQAGALLSKVSKLAAKATLTGLEFASGIPGSIGGAVVMNAGAYGGEMKDVIVEATAIDQNGNLMVFKNGELDFGYRRSVIKDKGYIVISAEMQIKKGNSHDIYALMDELDEKRAAKQPVNLPSAGSTFKRPIGHYAGKLIQDAGLKGLIHGGAMVSELHSGFIVNVDNATYEDIVTLIEIVRRTVKEKYSVDLEPEVKIVERD
ncbi:MAG: UDP-N-acetylmuramate dehydrogenase [Bacillota bacterium]|nr:UDP-N-acetylmuramate dehydrogenase [Bacillota bacterium]